MRKKISILMLLCLAFFGVARADLVEIGDGGTTNNTYLPGYNFYKYSLSQQIYTAEEIGMAGTINSVAFKNTGTEKTRTYNVYMLFTDKETFADGTDWVAMSSDDLVFSGSVTFTVGEWTTIELDTPFAYDGASNLLIGVADVSGAYTSSPHMACLVFNATSQSISAYRDSPGAYDITAPGVTGTVRNVKNQIQLDITPSGAAVCYKPTITVSDITHNQATLNWSGGSGVYNVAWRVVSPTPVGWNDIMNGTTNTSFELTGLEPLTAYEARVQSVCEGGLTSDWKEVSFTTTATAEEVGNGWSDNFDANLSWELINGTCTNAWAHGNANAISGQALYISNDGGTSNAYTVSSAAMVYATKLLHFNEGKYEFTYDWIAYGESTWDFLRVLLVPGSVTLTAGTSLPSGLTYQAVPTGWIALDGGSKLNLVSAWQNKSVAVNVPAGNYYLVMAWRDDTSSGTQPPAAVDNVSITPVTCAYDVEGLALGNITTNSATLTWTAGEATQWQVAYSTRSTFENAEYQIVSAATYEMTGLQSATEYYAKVRAYCGGEDYGSWSNIISFTTACEALTTYPYTENFDSYTGVTSGTTNNLPLCWNYINTCTYSYYAGYPLIYNASGYSHSGDNHLRFYSYTYTGSTTNYDPQDQYAILPPMENLDGKQISLFARGANANSTFKIGMMTNPYDASTFVEIVTVTPTTSYEEYTYLLEGVGNYVAFKMDAANSTVTSRTVYIDDITINFPPTCIKPTGLTASNVTRNSVTLSWNAAEGQDLWEIGYKTDEDEDYYWFVEPTENPYVLTGNPDRPLAPSTHYTVKVRANCGDGDYSDWSAETSFTTLIACATPTGLVASEVSPNSAKLNWSGNNEGYNVMYRTAAYSDGIYEEFNTSSLPSTWTQYTGLVDTVLAGTATLTTASSYKWITNSYALGAYNAKLNIYGTSVKTWLVTPEIYLGERETLEFDLALTAYNSANAASGTCDDDRFVVLINIGRGWGILREWNNTGSSYVYNNIATAGEHVSIDLSNYGGTIQIAFYGESTVSGNGDNDLHIDNVSVGLYHDAGPWQTVTVTDTTMVVLNQLASETSYEAKVQGDCNEFGTSDDSNMISFTTLEACPAPMDVEVSNLLHTSATLSWTGYSDSYNIEYAWYEALPAFSSFDFEDGVIPQDWDNTSNYPWAIVAENGGYYIQSTNQGVASSTSSISFTADYRSNGFISFDAKCMGEGISYDVCKFYIDGNLKLSLGENGDFWDTYTFEVSYGTHTFTWTYTKDSSVNPTGDAFSVDNIAMSLRNYHSGTPITGISETTYELINLIPNTLYIAWINSDCDPDAVSEEVQFTTLSPDHKVFVDANGVWSDAESWRPSGAPTLDQIAELRANVTIPSGCVAEAKRITITGSPTPTLTIADGAQLKTNATVKATVKKNIAGYGIDNADTDNGYVMLTTPTTSSYSPVSAGLVNDTLTYDLYNWSRTATDAEWHNYKQSNFSMYNGTGYLYANQNDVVLSFTGNIRANGTDYTVTPGYDTIVGGWNLYGNPFVCEAYLTSDTVAMAFYTLSGNTFVATTGPVLPMEGFFAQTPASGKKVIVTRTAPAKQGQLNMTVNQGSSLKDNAIIRFGEGNTLKKLSFFENSSKLFITMEGEDYAVVNADKSGEMPISFKTEEEGSYTLLFSNEEVNFSTLRLIDTLTGEEVNLLETPSYTFEAKTGDNANRFKLVYVTK